MESDIKRAELRLDKQLYDQIKYHADKQSISVNAWLAQAAAHYIAWINSDYDVPTATVQRLNQLVDAVSHLSEITIQSSDATTRGLNSLFTIIHGDAYLASDASSKSRDDQDTTD